MAHKAQVKKLVNDVSFNYALLREKGVRENILGLYLQLEGWTAVPIGFMRYMTAYGIIKLEISRNDFRITRCSYKNTLRNSAGFIDFDDEERSGEIDWKNIQEDLSSANQRLNNLISLMRIAESVEEYLSDDNPTVPGTLQLLALINTELEPTTRRIIASRNESIELDSIGFFKLNDIKSANTQIRELMLSIREYWLALIGEKDDRIQKTGTGISFRSH